MKTTTTIKNQRKEKGTDVRVLCQVCSQFFGTPRSCLECSNWNVCLPCLDREGEETRRVLRERGITI